MKRFAALIGIAVAVLLLGTLAVVAVKLLSGVGGRASRVDEAPQRDHAPAVRPSSSAVPDGSPPDLAAARSVAEAAARVGPTKLDEVSPQTNVSHAAGDFAEWILERRDNARVREELGALPEFALMMDATAAKGGKSCATGIPQDVRDDVAVTAGKLFYGSLVAGESVIRFVTVEPVPTNPKKWRFCGIATGLVTGEKEKGVELVGFFDPPASR